ncbi:uncharacterized protein ACIQIH_007403 isoform 1-T1 [Cyanocitta cristata]
MKMIKAMPMFILVFTGYLCNAQEESTTTNTVGYTERAGGLSTPWVGGKHIQSSSPSFEPSFEPSSELETEDHVEGRSLPTLVVAGVSIALVLLFILIVAAFWYAWKKSQEGSIVINPIPYGEAGVSLRALPVPEN